MSVIKYVGPFDEIDVEGIRIRRLEVVEVPSHLAASLRQQEDFEQPKSNSDQAKSATKNPRPAVDLAVGLDDPDSEPDEVPPPSNVLHGDQATEHDEPVPSEAQIDAAEDAASDDDVKES